MNINKTARKTDTIRKTDDKGAGTKSIRSSMDWQQAMVAYSDRYHELMLTEEDTPEAEAAEQAMSEAFTKVAYIVDGFFA